MKKISLNKRHIELIEKAIRYTISDLQYERHQALLHGCTVGTYDNEIEEFRQLKRYIQDEYLQDRPA